MNTLILILNAAYLLNRKITLCLREKAIIVTLFCSPIDFDPGFMAISFFSNLDRQKHFLLPLTYISFIERNDLIK